MLRNSFQEFCKVVRACFIQGVCDAMGVEATASIYDVSATSLEGNPVSLRRIKIKFY